MSGRGRGRGGRGNGRGGGHGWPWPPTTYHGDHTIDQSKNMKTVNQAERNANAVGQTNESQMIKPSQGAEMDDNSEAIDLTVKSKKSSDNPKPF